MSATGGVFLQEIVFGFYQVMQLYDMSQAFQSAGII